ncbi:hypothetical protein BOX15_Mlig025064g1, partial [Macrostomum lignano]
RTLQTQRGQTFCKRLLQSCPKQKGELIEQQFKLPGLQIEHSSTSSRKRIMGYTEESDPLVLSSRSSFRDKRCGRGVLTALVISFGLLSIIFLACFLYFAALYSEATKGTPPWLQDPASDQVLETYLYNGVTSDATVCSLIGGHVINVLNGSAMDAAVATVLCVGVANFHSAGIGGGSFLMHFDSKTKQVATFDYRETAPANASRDMFNGLPSNASTAGGLAIAVPGEVAGLHLAHSRFGRLPWRQVVAPVSQLLRNGQRVTKPLADAMASNFDELPSDGPYAELKRWMVNPATGRIYASGEVLRDEKLAATMDRIAEDPASFYNGSLADDIVQEMSDVGAILGAKDLRSYRPSEPAPISATLPCSRLRLHSMPPPCSGAVLGFILGILDGYDTRPEVKQQLDSYATFLHRVIEAFKFGYAKRSALGDADFVNVTALVTNLTSESYAAEARARITDDATHDVNYYGPSFEWPSDHGTTHVSLVDSEGNSVVVTSTINEYFGSKVKGPKTGILYNNEMDDFSVPNRTNSYDLPPSESNFIQPGKRPMSSMSPVFVTDVDSGELRYIGGGAGGSLITTAVAYVLARQIYLNETVKEATDAFRLHHQLVPNYIMYFNYTSKAQEEMLSALGRKGHQWKLEDSHSVVEMMHRLADGSWQASGDFRKPSKPAGY